MDSIHLNDLSGYKEDTQGLKNFKRRFSGPSLAGMLIGVAGFALFFAEIGATHYQPIPGQEMGFMDKLWFAFEGLAKQAGVPEKYVWFIPPGLFAGGMLLGALTMLVMSRSTPISSISNLKMEKYWNANPDPGSTEIVYVDRSSKTYFKRVYATVKYGGRIR